MFAHGLIQHALRVTGRIYNIDWFTLTPLCFALHEAIRLVALLGYAGIVRPFCPTLWYVKYLKHPPAYYDVWPLFTDCNDDYGITPSGVANDVYERL